MKYLILSVAVLIALTAPAFAEYVFKAGTTSQKIDVFVVDNTQTGTLSGNGLSTLAFNTSSLTAYYHREGGSATAITLATLSNATSAFSSGGFIAVDSTNMPGMYRLDVPDAALASGAKWVTINLKGAANMAPVSTLIRLTATDDQDATRGGMTALPNANAAASGGLLINGSNTGAAISIGSLALTGWANSGTFANTGTMSAGTFTITNGISAATINTSGAATFNSLAITGNLSAGSFNPGTTTFTALSLTNASTLSNLTVGTATNLTNPVTASNGPYLIGSGTATGGGATTISIASTSGIYTGDQLHLTAATGAGQGRTIAGVLNSTDLVVDRAWTVNPDNTTGYRILSGDAVSIDSSRGAKLASSQGSLTISTLTVGAGSVNLGSFTYGTLSGGTATIGTLAVTNSAGFGSFNPGTTTFTAATVTNGFAAGSLNITGGATISTGVTNGNGLTISGNGTGAGVKSTGGATGIGLLAQGGATSGSGARFTATAGSSVGLDLIGKTDMPGLYVAGGNSGATMAAWFDGTPSADGYGIFVAGGNTDGIGALIQANGGASTGLRINGGLNGINVVGGDIGMALSSSGSGPGWLVSSNTGDGLKAIGGSGVDIRGNITGNLSGSVGNVTGSITLNSTQGSVTFSSLAITNGLTAGTFGSGTTTFGLTTFGTLSLSNASNLSLLSTGTVSTATTVTNPVTVKGAHN